MIDLFDELNSILSKEEYKIAIRGMALKLLMMDKFGWRFVNYKHKLNYECFDLIILQ